MNYWLLGIFVAVPVGFVIGWLFLMWRFHRREMRDIIEKCLEIEKKCEVGFAVFYPPKEERYLYDKLVKRGTFMRSPMGDGYCFKHASELWKSTKVNKGFAEVRAGEYQDDQDNTVQVFKDEDGNIVRVVTNEEIEKERADGDSRSVH